MLNGTMLPVALPQIGQELSLTAVQVGWLVTGYFLVLGVAVPFFGRLADLYGIARLYAVGLSVLLLGSVVCGFAPDYPLLLVGRLFQGLGAAAVAGLGPAAVNFAYSPERRGGALGIFNAAAGAGAALGPVVGGTLTDALSWRYIFVVGALFGVLAPLALKILSGRGEDATGERMDWIGGILLGVAVAGALLALTWGAENGWSNALVGWSSGLAIVSASLFVGQQRRSRNPFIPRVLLQRSYVRLGTITLLLIGISLTVESIVPLPLADAKDLSASRIALVLLPPALLNVVWGPFAGRLADRYGTRALLVAAAAALVLALLMLSTFGVSGSIWVVSAIVVVVVTGGTLARLTIIKGVSLVTPQENQASAVAINEMLWMLGVGLGTAIFVATSTAREDSREGINLLYSGHFASYSDAFLVLAIPLLLGLLVSLVLVPGIAGSKSKL